MNVDPFAALHRGSESSPGGSLQCWKPAVSRRRWLGCSLSALAMAGCTPSEEAREEKAAATGHRRDIPLRILLVGHPQVSDAIEKSWSGIAEQPLEMNTLTLAETDKAAESALVDTSPLAAAARQSDLLIYPALLQGQLAQVNALTPFSDAALADDRMDGDALYAALRSGPLQYGKEMIAMPLGAVVPALLIATPDWEASETISWQEYNQRIAALPTGRAAEPLADGWAAAMFLYRANDYCDAAWLFDPDTLQPLFLREPYRRALTQMIEARQSYPEKLRGPEEIWQAIRGGDLDVAIGWPTSQAGNQAVGDVRVQPLPQSEQWFSEARQEWLDTDPLQRSVFLPAMGLVASISSQCRQTAAAHEFIRWLARDESSAQLRQRVPGFSETRSQEDKAVARRSGVDPVALQHAAYLRQRMSESRLRTMLRIPAAGRYLSQLDEQILLALEEKQSVEETLRNIVNEWETITIERGREEQLQNWRKSMGLRY